VAEALKRGAYFHPYHNMFLSAAHTVDDITKVMGITDDAFAAVNERRAKLEPHPAVVALLAMRR